MSNETYFSVKRDLAAFAAAISSKFRRVRVSLAICWRQGEMARVGAGSVCCADILESQCSCIFAM